jgi:hypothetical protein
MSEKSDAEVYRLAQAQKLLGLFEIAHGRPATSIDELTRWMQSPEGEAVVRRHLARVRSEKSGGISNLTRRRAG